MFKEIIPCADGGPEPLWGMDTETSYYVGIYDDKGTIISDFFDNEAEARAAYDRIDVPDATTLDAIARDLLAALTTLVANWDANHIPSAWDDLSPPNLDIEAARAAIAKAKENRDMFFTYDQNNSGGHFDIDDAVACNVIIEADSAEEADARAEEIGIYFDDNYSIDCSCCGTRWSRAWSDDSGKETPQIGSKDPADYSCWWTPVGEAYAHIYYKNGTKKSFIKREKAGA